MIKGVIFDLDGVLVTTDELHYRAWLRLAEREGIYFDREINHCLRGVSRMDSLEIILERAEKNYTPEEKQEMASYKNAIYGKLLDGLTEADVLPGVVETLDGLEKRGILMAVGSSSKNAGKILDKTGLAGRFNAIADGTDITRSKPAPEVFLCAAQKLGIDPAECAVVEDAEAGIQAAKAGGMLACAVSDACKSPLADARLNELTDLLNRSL